MSTVTFDETDAMGIELMDEQHRGFYELLGRLVAARAAGNRDDVVLNTLDDMITYVGEHFATEEHYMREFGYPDFLEHREQHAGFVRKIIEIHRRHRRGEEALDEELLEYLGAWFTDHIRQEDPKYAELFKANGM